MFKDAASPEHVSTSLPPSLPVPGAEGVWPGVACVHGCSAPPGLQGAAVLHREDGGLSGDEPGCGTKPAAPQSRPAHLPAAAAA